MKIGLSVPQLGPHVTARVIREFCQRAEQLGYDGLWVQDHVFYPTAATPTYAGVRDLGVPHQYQSVLAPTELLACVAAWTEHIRIGTSVLVAGYYSPVRLAQQLATLDILSGGRLDVGIGAGWSPEEHALFGVETDHRWARMEELVRVLKVCWGEDPVSFDGPNFHVPSSIVRPKPVQRPHPLLLCGTGPTPATFARIERSFDGWNPGGLTVSQVRAALAERASATFPVHCRIMLQKPQTREDETGDTVDWCIAQVHEARSAGLAGVILDASFWSGIDCPDAWLTVPELFRDALSAPIGR